MVNYYLNRNLTNNKDKTMTKPSLKGVLKTWKEDRGFGFISPENGGRDLFIHISALGEPSRRPVPGDVIHYQIARDRHGKLRAINASIEGVASQARTYTSDEKENGKFGWLKIAIACGALMAIGALFLYLKTENII